MLSGISSLMFAGEVDTQIQLSNISVCLKSILKSFNMIGTLILKSFINDLQLDGALASQNKHQNQHNCNEQ